MVCGILVKNIIDNIHMIFFFLKKRTCGSGEDVILDFLLFKALLLLIYCLIPPLFVGFCVDQEERAGHFALIGFPISCYC